MDAERGMAVDEGVEIGPIRKAVTIERPVEHVFGVFTDRMGEWWPVGTHSVFADDRGTRPETVVFEGRLGGRVYERMADGREADWATVTAWEPPHRLVLAWQPNPERITPTEVEV